MKYSVKTLRAAGLEARWTKNSNGRPVIVARNPEATNKTWWHVSATMWEDMKKDGIKEALESHTLLGDIFSVPI